MIGDHIDYWMEDDIPLGEPAAQPARAGWAPLTEEERMKIEEYIKKHGVTRIPGYGDPEFAELHRRRMREYDAPARKKAAMLASGVIP